MTGGVTCSDILGLRWPGPRSSWVPLLEEPRAICKLRRYHRQQRPLPRLVGCHDPSLLLFHRNGDCRGMNARFFSDARV